MPISSAINFPGVCSRPNFLNHHTIILSFIFQQPDTMTLYIPFDDTHIIYDSEDPFGIVAVHFSLLPIYIMVFYTSWFLITREIEPVIAVAGQVCNDFANKILKQIFKQARPEFHRDFGKGSHGITYGMPSAHSQFMGFFAAYYIITTCFATPALLRWKIFMSLGLFTACIGVACSRWYLMYHTVEQVIIGVGCGLSTGTLFAFIVILFRDVGVVDWVLLWRIVRLFWIKDSYYHNYRLFKSEFEELEAAKRKKND